METEDILRVIRKSVVTSYLEKVIYDGDLDKFIAFAREHSEDEGIETEELLKFLKKLEKNYLPESEENKEWHNILHIIGETTGCNVNGFKGDKTVMIENEELTEAEFDDYVTIDTKTAKINIESINKALSVIGYKLEFLEALGLPFVADGFQNIIRFKVIKLD